MTEPSPGQQPAPGVWSTPWHTMSWAGGRQTHLGPSVCVTHLHVPPTPAKTLVARRRLALGSRRKGAVGSKHVGQATRDLEKQASSPARAQVSDWSRQSQKGGGGGVGDGCTGLRGAASWATSEDCGLGCSVQGKTECQQHKDPLDPSACQALEVLQSHRGRWQAGVPPSPARWLQEEVSLPGRGNFEKGACGHGQASGGHFQGMGHSSKEAQDQDGKKKVPWVTAPPPPPPCQPAEEARAFTAPRRMGLVREGWRRGCRRAWRLSY